MGAALYIVLDSAAPGFDPSVNGKALSWKEGRLAAIAERLGVTPLMEFFSECETDAAEFGDDSSGDLNLPLVGQEQ